MGFSWAFPFHSIDPTFRVRGGLAMSTPVLRRRPVFVCSAYFSDEAPLTLGMSW